MSYVTNIGKKDDHFEQWSSDKYFTKWGQINDYYFKCI